MHIPLQDTMKEPKPNKQHSQPWKPLTASYCCSSEDHIFLRNLSKCRPTSSELSKNIGRQMSSFRKLSFYDMSLNGSSSSQINEDLAQSFGGELYDFELSEIRGITHNFSTNFLLGEGGFGRVHKGFVDEKVRVGLKAQPVAVKVLDIEGLQGHQEWLAEVIFLGQLRHPNLVKLIGYCCEDEERVLVYEFMARGNLENHLFKRLSISLPWATRLKIAIGAAKGLVFLHGVEKPVIYRDFKTSNVLLDSDFNAKLSDFGLTKMGPGGSNTEVTAHVMGTHGYAAPEYVSTGHLTTKSDIYSFGVVLLELLTGRRAVEKTRPKSEQNLVDRTKPYLTSSRRLRYIMDPRLMGQYSVKGAKEIGLLAQQCVSLNPKDRPKMSAIIETLESLQGLRDMAITHGQWPASTKSGCNTGNVKGRREIGFGRKSAAVAASPRSK